MLIKSNQIEKTIDNTEKREREREGEEKKWQRKIYKKNHFFLFIQNYFHLGITNNISYFVYLNKQLQNLIFLVNCVPKVVFGNE